MLFGLLILLAIAIYAMPPAKRQRCVDVAIALLQALKAAATRRDAEYDAFRAALRTRAPLPIATVALAAVNVAIFAGMAFGAGHFSDPDVLVRWGASLGPRTTNGEWWRLVTAMFVHANAAVLIVNVAALLQIGELLERLVGRTAFLAIYVLGGMFANIVTLAAYPLVAGAGASGAVCALYGLLLAACGWMAVRRSDFRVAPIALEKLAPVSVLFLVTALVDGRVIVSGELAALVFAAVSGVVLARTADAATVRPRLVAAVCVPAIVVVVGWAIPLRGITDVRPEIARLIALEERTTRAYRTALGHPEAILRTIVPELQAAEARLKSLTNVPPEQQAQLHDAQEYVQLREQSWKLRAQGLRAMDDTPDNETSGEPAADARFRRRAETSYRRNLTLLGNADGAERRSLEVFQRLRKALAS